MLTLTRKLGEALRIGDNVVIIIREIRRNSVRISIDCPLETKIYREEVYQNISECEYCHGAGWNQDPMASDEDNTCLACNGTGKQRNK